MSNNEFSTSHEEEIAPAPIDHYTEVIEGLVEKAQNIPFSFDAETASTINPNGQVDIFALGSHIKDVTGLSSKEFTAEFPRETGMSVEADDKSWKAAISVFNKPLNPDSDVAEKIRCAVLVMQNKHPEDLSVTDKSLAIIIGEKGISSRTDELYGERNGKLSLPQEELLKIADDILQRIDEKVEAA